MNIIKSVLVVFLSWAFFGQSIVFAAVEIDCRSPAYLAADGLCYGPKPILSHIVVREGEKFLINKYCSPTRVAWWALKGAQTCLGDETVSVVDGVVVVSQGGQLQIEVVNGSKVIVLVCIGSMLLSFILLAVGNISGDKRTFTPAAALAVGVVVMAFALIFINYEHSPITVPLAGSVAFMVFLFIISVFDSVKFDSVTDGQSSIKNTYLIGIVAILLLGMVYILS